MAQIESPYLSVEQSKRTFILTKLPLGVVAKIAYTAIRGKSQEEGAVQRLLSPKRISSIRDFTLNVGEYPGAIVLNWVSQGNPVKRHKNQLLFSDEQHSAQIIDGQHRLAGINEAVKENPEISKYEIPVVIYESLNTRECADIFLSINTEQKTVPRSLVFDLYGIASDHLVDPSAVRARDIATFLNEEETSPYRDSIKLPGAPRRRGGIALSTVVSAIKPLAGEKGDFERIGITELELQKKVLLNFFTAIQKKYGNEWDKSTNAFQYAAGFVGALEFFQLKMIPYCNEKSSFTSETIEKALRLDESSLIYQSQVKGFSGTKSQNKIYQLLVESFNIEAGHIKEFEI